MAKKPAARKKKRAPKLAPEASRGEGRGEYWRGILASPEN